MSAIKEELDHTHERIQEIAGNLWQLQARIHENRDAFGHGLDDEGRETHQRLERLVEEAGDKLDEAENVVKALSLSVSDG